MKKGRSARSSVIGLQVVQCQGSLTRDRMLEGHTPFIRPNIFDRLAHEKQHLCQGQFVIFRASQDPEDVGLRRPVR